MSGLQVDEQPALGFALNEADAELAGQLGAEAGAGDPAADDQDIHVDHNCGWLRF